MDVSTKAKNDFIACTLRELPDDKKVAAANDAVRENPGNRPSPKRVLDLLRLVLPGLSAKVSLPDIVLQPEHLAVMTSKYWGAKGVKLTVSFLDDPDADLAARILAHMNAWSAYCNVAFEQLARGGVVRIARTPGDGHWSYLGVDILSIPVNQPTMNLDSFTMDTPEAEYHRVVHHEAGHALGYPHEHLRSALIKLLDVQKTIAWGRAELGWDEAMVRAQILTPVSESSLMGTPKADQDSIMCYQLPGSITKNGKPIRGGTDIDARDQAFAGKIYPREVIPPSPPCQSTIEATP